MSKHGGVLDWKPGCLTVNLGRLIWMKPAFIQEEIRQFWKKQGYCEAEPLPYERNSEGLIVTQNISGFYQVGTDTLDRVIDCLPF